MGLVRERGLKETTFIVDSRPGTITYYIISSHPHNKTLRQVYYIPQFIDEENVRKRCPLDLNWDLHPCMLNSKPRSLHTTQLVWITWLREGKGGIMETWNQEDFNNC